MPTIKRILHPTDFSEGSLRAQEYALDFAARFDAEVHLLHITVPQASAITAEMDHSLSASSPHTQRLRARLQEGLPEGTEAVLALRAGVPADEIVAYAESIGADMIVVGTKALTGLRRLVLGSVAEAVLRDASCPVLVVGPERAH